MRTNVLIPVVAGIAVAAGCGYIMLIHREADSLQYRYAYDDQGRVTEIVDPAGNRTTVRYEMEGRRLRRIVKQLPDSAEVALTFDQFGRPASMSDGPGPVLYDYDGFNRLTGVRKEGQPTLSYEYSDNDRIDSLQVGEWKVRFGYDFLGRLERMETPQGVVSYAYRPGEGQVIRTLPNGIRTEFQYAPGGSLQSITHVGPSNYVIARLGYAYRPDGLIQTIAEETPQRQKQTTYEYDGLRRVTAVNDSELGRTEYSYDRTGNRVVAGTATHAAYDWAGRLLQYGGRAAKQDAAGNLLTYSQREKTRAFEFDALSQLKSTSGGRVQFEYGGDGRLLSRTGPDGKVSFVTDPQSPAFRPLAASDSQGKRTFYLWEGGVPLATVSGGRVQFLLGDHLGSVRWIADAAGQITRSIDYEPYGSPQGAEAPGIFEPRFAGLFYDAGADLYVTRARMYDPRLGRFLQREPDLRQTAAPWNRASVYTYCGGDPLNRVDATGAEPQLPQSLDFNTWYAQNSAAAIASANPSNWYSNWFLVGMEATGWDALGGVLATVTHKPANFGQSVGQFLPAVATAGAALARLPEAINIAALTPSALSYGTNLYQGHYGEAVLDAFSMGLSGCNVGKNLTQTADGMLAKGNSLKAAEQAGQQLFSFMSGNSADVLRQAHVMQYAGASLQNFDLFRAVSDAATQKESFPMFPSPVGGVSLRGAGSALKNLGQLAGMAFDKASGKWMLISRQGGDLTLPPLRLDDIVTVFRAVYEHGEAPSVSIDPNPADPQGPTMLIRHGPGTGNSYVGWVLLEADRVMKTYNQGYDNVNCRPVRTQVPGYRSAVEMGFSGDNGSAWERFWIVPSKVRYTTGDQGKVSLVDLQLEVESQRMTLRNGKLEPAPNPKPSAQADLFRKWFTQHYDEIAKERSATPPAASGITASVAFFEELRRVALLAAIAESLRDQGVPMPDWMREYKVSPCPMPESTPAIVVTASDPQNSACRSDTSAAWRESGVRLRIYGGVRLSPADTAVERQAGAPLVEAFAGSALPALMAAPMVAPVTFQHEGVVHQGTALPGPGARDVLASQLTETDLAVPLPVVGSGEIRVTRKFHSFFIPDDSFGPGWTMDLASLQERPHPVKRTSSSSQYQIMHEINCPLGTCTVSIPDSTGKILGLVAANESAIGSPTRAVAFADGRRWHFDAAGSLMATVNGPLMQVYRRDSALRIRRIEGWLGKRLLADIQLEYGNGNHLVSAKGSDGRVVRYSYSHAGQLIQVDGPSGRFEYKYKDGLVTEVRSGGKLQRQFNYSERGQLMTERLANGEEVVYGVASDPTGIAVTATRGKAVETVHYDLSMQPRSRVMEDGTLVNWETSGGGERVTSVTSPDGLAGVLKTSSDGKIEEWQFAEGGRVGLERDVAGRTTRISRNGRVVTQQEWLSDGRLRSAASPATEVHPRYSAEGVLAGLLFAAPGQGEKLSRWLSLDYDDLGRPNKLTDYSGAEFKVGYGATGAPVAATSKQGAVELRRNDLGRVESLKTSWGVQQTFNYASGDGLVQSIDVVSGGKAARVDFESGKPVGIRDFDGNRTLLTYSGDRLRSVRAPADLSCAYDYDEHGRMTSLNCPGAYRMVYRYDKAGRVAGVVQESAK
jgi:RHS repeat-associated protein